METTTQVTGSVVSADGTTIGYRQLGRGTAIIRICSAAMRPVSCFAFMARLTAMFVGRISEA